MHVRDGLLLPHVSDAQCVSIPYLTLRSAHESTAVSQTLREPLIADMVSHMSNLRKIW